MLTLRVSSNWGETGDLPGMRRWTMRLLDELAAVPGVRQAALATSVPGVPSNFQVRVQVVEGRAPTDPPVLADAQAVSPTYFATMQIPLLSGETCRESGPPGMLVNRSFADTYLDGRVAGKHLVAGPGGRPLEIRGVVSDTREHGLDKTPQPAIYFCNFIAQPGSVFLVRTQGEPLAMGETLRRKVHEIEPTRSVFEVMPLQDHLSDANSENRLRTILLACFAATAMGLASVGLYGTLSYLVNTRRREVGLRLALGAKREQIAAHFLGHGLRVTVPATAAGLALSLGAAPLLAGLLYGVSPMDPRTLAAVTLAVISVGAVASLLPAVRAARTEPARVLREE
jgi:putative ABC transport system permease protein